jgi:hypothetical protein
MHMGSERGEYIVIEEQEEMVMNVPLPSQSTRMKQVHSILFIGKMG